uniref:Kri1-like C-terminal domain-containing protein n=1 Tax=Leersia perrieri TaxID=77586 RepID=A0A0D9WHZ5_9ORYZ
MKKDILAGSSSDEESGGEGEDISKIKINEEYARRFEYNKRREALQRLEELKKKRLADGGGEEDADEDDDSSSDDDEDAAAVASRRVDRRVFEVIRKIRSGDAAILDKEAKMYSSSSDDEKEGEKPKEEKRKKKKEKPLYLKDVNARHLLEEGPESAAGSSHGDGRSSKYEKIAYDEQQRKGLEEFLKAEKAEFGDGDGDEDDLFQVKPKKKKGGDDDDGEKEDDDEEKETEKILGEIFGDDEELDENEKFLKDYLLTRPYLASGNEKKFSMEDIQEVSDEEEDLLDQEDYESFYNFRHEEAAATGAQVDRVMGHSRFVEGSVRKKESSRKQQRKSKEERIARAKQEQVEELKHLKNLKKKEIAEKLERIQAIAGIDSDAACKLGADDLEDDFDPEDYDRKMQEMFNDNYYDADDVDPGFGSGEEIDLEKPDFDKEDELLGLPKDCAHDGLEEGSAATSEGASRKKKDGKEIANGEEIGQKTKGKISLKDKVELEKEMEEYYKLDYEDTIGDLKTRFKYRQVKPNSFGLSTYEILASDDKDLNQYVSMKKIAPYREQEWKVTHHRKLSKDSILGGQSKEGKKVKTKKKSKSEEGPPASSEQEKEELPNEQEDAAGKRKSTRSERRKRRREDLKIAPKRQAAYGKINPKRQSFANWITAS